MIVTPLTPTTPGPSTPRTPSSTRRAPTCASAYCTPSTAMAEGAIFPFPGPAPALNQRELYLRALEQEREEILAEAYAAKRSGSPNSLSNYSVQYAHDSEDEDDDDQERGHPRFDERGRQLRFRETVRQRQARLEFLRRQDFARRIAHRGLEDAKASAYAIKRLPPPRARPIERVNAATKIQRIWRLHHAVKSLENLTQRVREAHERFLEESKTDYEDAWKTHAETLHELLRELGERTGVLALASSSQSQSHSTGASSVSAKSDTHALHPRVRIAARSAMEALRSELSLLDRAQISRHHSFASSSSFSPKTPFLSGPFSSDSEDEDSDDDFNDDEDSDSDDEDLDYASYTYTPPQSQSQPLISTELYVVDEEDEDGIDLEEHIPSSNAMRLYTYPSPPASPTKSMRSAHLRSRHAPFSTPLKVAPTPTPIPSPTNVPSLIRSHLARSPSLASIPEEDEEF